MASPRIRPRPRNRLKTEEENEQGAIAGVDGESLVAGENSQRNHDDAANLIHRATIQVRDARLNVEDGTHRIERVFARLLLIIHECLGQIDIVMGASVDVRGLVVSLDAIDAVGTCLNRRPRQ